MKIGVVGNGIVGHATARSFLEHVEEVRVHDIDLRKSTHHLQHVLECDLIFICLPTPQKHPADGLGYDLSALDSFFSIVTGSAKCLVLKSTVIPGTSRMLSKKYRLHNLVHSPEFLTARCSVVDAQMPTRSIIGETLSFQKSSCGAMLEGLLWNRFPGIPILKMSSDESEAVKIVQNAFFATCVAFWNEAHSLVGDKLNLNWSTVMRAILSDGRISHSHTQVPGPDGKYGFGGTCLPKDLSAFMQMCHDSGVVHPVTSGVWARNMVDRERLVEE